MIDRIKAVWATVKADAAALWEKDKVWFLLLFGALLAAKFRDILISLIVGAAKTGVEKAEAKNDDLQKKEDTANNQANALVDDAKAQEAKNQENPVIDENWDKKV